MVIIETDRVLIREYEAQDERDLIRIASKDYVTRWLPDWLGCEQWALRWIEGRVASGYKLDDPMKKFLSYAVIEKSTGIMIGQVSCGDFEGRELGVGYFMDEDYSSLGYMTEAMQAFIGHLFRHYPARHLIATMQPDNEASNAVARKLGFQYVGTIMMKDDGQAEELPFCYYRLDRR